MADVKREDNADSHADKRWDSFLIGKKIYELRKRCGMTQMQLADCIGVSDAAIRNYESNRAIPKECNIRKMAKAFGVPLESLRFYDFGSDPDIVRNALYQISEVYGFEVIEEGDNLLLIPMGVFMKTMTAEWEEHYRATKEHDGKLSMKDYYLWMESFTAPFTTSDFPKRYIFDKGGEMKYIENWAAYNFASRIKQIRTSRDMTQGDFASLLGIKLGVYRSYEQGRRLPMVSVIESMAEKLGVSSGSLTFFDFGSPVQASHVLFQLEDEIGLHPEVREDGSYVISCHLG